MNYKKIAKETLDAVGGKENIVTAAHCATRLRLVLKDEKIVDKKTLEKVEGVKGTFFNSGQFQIIFGTGTVNKVYDEFIAVSGTTESSKDEAKKVAASKLNPFQRVIRVLADIFIPIIPAIVASGLLMGLVNAATYLSDNHFITLDTKGSTFILLNIFSNAAYTFLPILIAFSAAKVFGANQFLGAVIGMIMIHPSLQNAWTISGGIKQHLPVWFGLYKMPMVGYQGHVIPIVIAVFLLSVIEKRLHKVVPEIIDLFVTPLVSVIATAYLTLTIIGPVLFTAENYLVTGIQGLITLPFGIGGLVMGGIYSATVVTGVHQMYTIIDIGQLSKFGYTYFTPIASAANVAQGGAALAVAIKTKSKKIKSLATPAALSACMGITEPAIFGVNLRFRRPFIAGAIGGAAGGFYCSLVGLGAKGMGVTGIFGVLLCLETPIKYILSFIISFGVAFILALIFGWDESDEMEPEDLEID